MAYPGDGQRWQVHSNALKSVPMGDRRFAVYDHHIGRISLQTDHIRHAIDEAYRLNLAQYEYGVRTAGAQNAG